MKKAVSFILAAIMLIMLPAGAFADSAQCSCDTPPVVMSTASAPSSITTTATAHRALFSRWAPLR